MISCLILNKHKKTKTQSRDVGTSFFDDFFLQVPEKHVLQLSVKLRSPLKENEKLMRIIRFDRENADVSYFTSTYYSCL